MIDKPPRVDPPPPPTPEQPTRPIPELQQRLDAIRAWKQAEQDARQPAGPRTANAENTAEHAANEETVPQPQEADDSPTRANKDDVAESVEAMPAPDVLTVDQKEEFLAYERQLAADGKTRSTLGNEPEMVYQRSKCGDTEFRLSPDGSLPQATWADGLNRDEALAKDSKYVASTSSSFYKPETLPPYLAAQAQQDADIRLNKYKNVIDDPANPVRGLEIITNDPGAAEFFASRMAALNVPGKVTVEG